jgi:hypothetical protein
LVKTESIILSKELKSKVKNVHNEVEQIKLQEVVKQLDNFQTLNHVKNNHLTALMIGYELNSQLDNFQSHD